MKLEGAIPAVIRKLIIPYLSGALITPHMNPNVIFEISNCSQPSGRRNCSHTIGIAIITLNYVNLLACTCHVLYVDHLICNFMTCTFDMSGKLMREGCFDESKNSNKGSLKLLFFVVKSVGFEQNKNFDVYDMTCS